jgi:hypothetical protein
MDEVADKVDAKRLGQGSADLGWGSAMSKCLQTYLGILTGWVKKRGMKPVNY